MRRSSPRLRRSFLVLCGAAVALTAAGCGTGGLDRGTADTSNGEKLFKEKCGICHTLAAAGSNGTTGPNLDDAFAYDRKQGFRESTIRAIVADQIRFPSRGTNTKDDAQMPANLVEGADADDVAAYVADVAGTGEKPAGGGGVNPKTTDGKTIFTEAGCSGCHTLKAAGSTGTVGPNLDQAKPSFDLVVERVTNGMGAMPSFKDKLTQEQIEAVAKFVSSSTGGTQQ